MTGLPTGSYKAQFAWEFSESEVKEFEKARRFLPKYITQYYSGQLSEATANPVGAAEETVTSGINAAMVPALPVNRAPPVVSGTPAVASPLSCSSGSWTGEPELKLSIGWPLTSPFGYQWLRSRVRRVLRRSLGAALIDATTLAQQTRRCRFHRRASVRARAAPWGRRSAAMGRKSQEIRSRFNSSVVYRRGLQHRDARFDSSVPRRMVRVRAELRQGAVLALRRLPVVLERDAQSPGRT